MGVITTLFASASINGLTLVLHQLLPFWLSIVIAILPGFVIGMVLSALLNSGVRKLWKKDLGEVNFIEGVLIPTIITTSLGLLLVSGRVGLGPKSAPTSGINATGRTR